MSIPLSRTVDYVGKRTNRMPVLNPVQVGARIRERREHQGIQQEQLAEMIGISQGTLSSIERGRTKNPEARTILAIAAALQTSPYVLMYDHVPPEAMQHTVAALVELWDRLSDRQRIQVVAYAQGLVDGGKDAPDKPSGQNLPRLPGPPRRGSH